MGAVPPRAEVQEVKQTNAVLQTHPAQGCLRGAGTGRPLGSRASAGQTPSVAGGSCPVKLHGRGSRGFTLRVMRACRCGDYSENQVKTNLSDPSRGHVCVPGLRGGVSGAIPMLVAANQPRPENPANPGRAAACGG